VAQSKVKQPAGIQNDPLRRIDRTLGAALCSVGHRASALASPVLRLHSCCARIASDIT
jgi:hypothetical protein